MKCKVFLVLITFFTFSFLLFPSSIPVYAVDPPCTLKPENQIRIDYEAKYGPCPAGLTEIENTVGNVISVIVGLGFIAMLVMVLMAGLKYLTSGGEPKAVQSAHYTLTWSLLGLLFFAVAWVILQLIESFTGVKVTTFDIKTLCGDAFEFCKTKP